MIYKEQSPSNRIVVALSAALLLSIGQFDCHAQTQVNKITSIQVDFIQGAASGNPASPEIVLSSSWSCTRRVMASTGTYATSFLGYAPQSGSGTAYIHLRVKYTCVDPTKPPSPAPENLTYSWTSSNTNNATPPVQSGSALKMKMENFPGGVNADSSTRGQQVVWKLSASATQAVDGVTTKFNTSGTAPTVTCINGTLSQTGGSTTGGSTTGGTTTGGTTTGGTTTGGTTTGGGIATSGVRINLINLTGSTVTTTYATGTYNPTNSLRSMRLNLRGGGRISP